MEKEKLSSYCKRVREETGLTVPNFAAFKGVSDTQVLRIENGFYDNNPSPLVISRICATYGLSVENLNRVDIKLDDDFINKVKAYSVIEKPSNKREEYLHYFVDEYLKSNGFLNIEFSELYSSELDKREKRKFNLKKISERYDIKCVNTEGINTYCFLIEDPITINADIDHKKIVNSIKDILYYLVSSSLFDNNNIIVYLLTPSESIFNYIKNLVNPNNFNNHLQNITFKFATVRTNRKILVG